jgi:hypothetical protein
MLDTDLVRGRLVAVATAGAVATVACVVLAVVLSLVAGQTWAVLVQGHAVEAGLFAISLSVVGAVVLHRFPRHGLGWLFLGIAVVEGVDLLATGLSLRLAAAGSTGWLVGWLAWLGRWLWLVGWGAMLSLVAVLFPDGVLPSPRWRVLVWTATTALLVGCVAAAVQPGPGEVAAATAAGDPSAAVARPPSLRWRSVSCWGVGWSGWLGWPCGPCGRGELVAGSWAGSSQ